MPRLDGKVALISGAARGLGAAEAALFAREGAKVVLGDLVDDGGRAVAADIAAAGGQAEFVHLDVTDAGQWQLAVAAAEQRFERLDILVNNAGIAQHPAPVEELPPQEWERVLGVNLTGQFLGIQAAIPALRRAGGGSIINTSSVAGLVASRAVAYGASKGGVRLMTKSVALQGAEYGIRCNCVHPGPIDTEFDGPFRNESTLPRTLARIPLGRLARPLEIAYGVLYLASDESSFVTGTELIIDGGITAI
jgi:NAD(P)-dependent dehydrogenase (short-subunit alcohol dehydrogenase family)